MNINKVLIIIPTFNEATGIRGVIESLVLGLPEDTNLQMVVADGGSIDGTIETVSRLSLQYPFLRLLHNEKRFQSAGINKAVFSCGTLPDVIIRCDAHAVYPPKFVENLIASLKESKADSVVVPMDSMGKTCFQKGLAWVSDTRIGSGGSAHRGGNKSLYVDHGHHAAFRAQKFLALGGYDETFTHNEDAEYDRRVIATQGKIYLDSSIRIGYFPRKGVLALWRQYFNYGMGRSKTVKKHPGSMKLRQFLVPLNFLLCICCTIIGVWKPHALIFPAFYLSILAATSIWLALKHRSRCGFIGGFAAGIMHTAWAAGFTKGYIFLRQSPWKNIRANELFKNA